MKQQKHNTHAAVETRGGSKGSMEPPLLVNIIQKLQCQLAISDCV